MAGSILSFAKEKETSAKQKLVHTSGTMRAEIPAFEIPPYKGERYEDQVPDTLDIAERANLMVRALSTPCNALDVYYQKDFLPFLYCVKYFEALPLLRTATGNQQNQFIDREWMEKILGSLGPDGLSYFRCQDPAQQTQYEI
jgi:hypothetical protein